MPGYTRPRPDTRRFWPNLALCPAVLAKLRYPPVSDACLCALSQLHHVKTHSTLMRDMPNTALSATTSCRYPRGTTPLNMNMPCCPSDSRRCRGPRFWRSLFVGDISMDGICELCSEAVGYPAEHTAPFDTFQDDPADTWWGMVLFSTARPIFCLWL
ncbi:hypothetical protein ARMGADRAFT_778242 [Armillaria gallica]|uniref:Uncharacterized protein n=1 Tax=Armillaria gallica TaxID=47427 RepID=A0A2H3D1U7_ARMGA|nr:hypothetical protein ARMGADRAFT_778242 [Armillaria gallica]